VQNGAQPSDWKPVPTIGPGVSEIRIRTKDQYRVCYLATFAEGVYVLHAFHKTTQRTSEADLELARSRLRHVLQHRQQR
jgi:phage-related protein